MTYYARSVWVPPAPPITGSALIRWADVDSIVFHWPAGNTPDGDPTDRTDVAAYLRAIQTAYVRDRGYSFGYSFAFDHRGDVYQGRGWDIRPAATLDHNGHTVAFMLVLDEDAPDVPEPMAEAVRAYVAEAEQRAGRPLTLTGHGRLTTTSGAGTVTACPGPVILSAIDTGRFRYSDGMSPSPVRIVRHRGYVNTWLVGAGPALHLTPETFDSYTKAGVPLIVHDPHPQALRCYLAQSGLTAADLVKSGE